MTKKQTNSLKGILLENKNTLIQFNFRIDQAAKTQLEFLRLEIGSKSIQILMTEAINNLFEKYEKNQ